MKQVGVVVVQLALLVAPGFAAAEMRSFIKEYSYQATAVDTKATCSAIAFEQVKRGLLEELGSYVESTTVVQDGQIAADDITTLTAGVVQTKILEETWDGKRYWLRAELAADPAEVAASIAKIKNDEYLAQELAESQAEKEYALGEIELLQEELSATGASSETREQYRQAVNQLQSDRFFQQGSAFTLAGNYEDAATAYTRAVSYRPDYAPAYFNRSVVYISLGRYQLAANDVGRAMTLKPGSTNAYYRRAMFYQRGREGNRVVEAPQRRNAGSKKPANPLQVFLEKTRQERRLARVDWREKAPTGAFERDHPNRPPIGFRAPKGTQRPKREAE